MNSDEDIEHALHRWLTGQVPDHYVTQVFGPHMLQRWQAMLVSIVEESDIPIVHDETTLQPRPWSTNMHPTRYIDGIANQEDGLSQSVNRFRQHTIRAKLLHQSRLRPLEMEYQHSLGMNYLTDVEITPGRQAQATTTANNCPRTIAPATTAQEHASQFHRWYPTRQAVPPDQATGMFMQPTDEHNPVRELQTWHTVWDKKLIHNGLPNIMITVIFFQYYQLINLNQVKHHGGDVEPHQWELQEDGTPVIRYYPNRMNFLPKQLVHKFPSIIQETQRSILMSWNEYIDDPDVMAGPSGLRILQFTAYQFRVLVRKGTNPDMTTMPNLYQLWHWGYIKFRSVNEELWIFTHNFADPQTMARLEQTCVQCHRLWTVQVMPSTAGLVPILPKTQDLCVAVHNTNPPFHQPMAAKYNTISGIMTSQAVSNIVFRKVHADVQLHRTWPSVDSAVQSDYDDDTFLLPDECPTNIWTDTLQKVTNTTSWTAPSESDIRTKLTVDHIFHDMLPHMVWTPRFAIPLTSQQTHAIQISTKAAHVLHRLWDPLIFTFADPCHASHGHDTGHSSQPRFTEKFYKIDTDGHIPMIAIPASSIKEAHADWAWFQSQQ
ncbi:unnamed protein product, partial [Symbiodinium natans]